ncbi:MAG: hypothetical protein HQ519_02495 [Planctomycetes bacterium]|nr:hypothetical protein [Planctomycetota bacterium]
MFATLTTLLLVAAQSDPQIEVMVTNVLNWPQSEVPGYPGVTFRANRFSLLDVSANGRWVLSADTNGAPYSLLLRDNGDVLLDETLMAPWAPTEQVIGFDYYSIDSNGEVVAAVKTRKSGVTYPYLMRFNGNSWVVEARPGDPIPGLSGGFYGSLFLNPIAIENGTTAFTNDGLGGFSSGFNEMAWADGVVLAQIGFDSPLGQFGGTNTTWGGFASYQGMSMSGDGQHSLIRGYLGTGNPDVLAYDDTVMIQEGFPVPGSGLTQNVGQFYFSNISADGDWWASGSNSSGNENWVVRDGTLMAKTGQPIISGETRLWTAIAGAPFWFASSNADVYYIGGQTDGTWGNEDVVVYNDTQVLLAKGDPIDLDGNGSYDDNVEFFGISSGGGVDHLGRLILIIIVRDTVTLNTGEAVVRITPGSVRFDLSDLIAGQQATATISGGTPGHIARLAYSLNGAGPTALNTPFGEILLSLSSPWVDLPLLTLDAQGEAVWSQTLPANLAGVSIWMQGAVYDAISLKLTRGRAGVIQ